MQLTIAMIICTSASIVNISSKSIRGGSDKEIVEQGER